MPVDTIDQLEQDIVDIEGRNIASQAQGRRTLGQDLSGAMQGALKSAEVLQKNEINVQKQKEADELLKSGVQGITAYGQELQLADTTVYENMAANVKDPKELINIYSLMRKKADTEVKQKAHQETIFSLRDVLEEAMTTADPEKIAIAGNKINNAKGSTTDPDVIKQLESMEKGLNDASARAGSGKGGKGKGTFGKLYDENERELPTIQQDRARISKVQDALTFGSKGGQRVLGTSINKQIAIQDALDTITGIEEGEFEGTQQIGQEIASIIAQVLSTGGQSTESQQRALFPNSWAGSVKNKIQEIKGKPMDAIPKPLLKQLEHMLTREKNFWDSRIADVNKSLAGTLAPIFNTVAVNPNTGKRSRPNRGAQKQFAAWLLSHVKDSGSTADRAGTDRTLDVLDLMASEEDKARFIKEARDSDITLKKATSFEDTIRDIAGGGSVTPSDRPTATRQATAPTEEALPVQAEAPKDPLGLGI
ncbi:hypothetical protein QUF61_17510 [Candidatus Venteria ishoeyi]|uniref:hypothetical protein n=1 Tax=Candidatus Venteria ishoeyi TaxID=1899563 RepID=UPI0025A526ED|nr:hypothetical protein [Candidatus Venteria ishoeyi]MDM8548292.1 hypothetical protein [Candidatus Venteria ishoeyi]